MIEQSLWKILAFLMAVILIFVAPTLTIYDRMDAMTYNVVNTEVTKFCDGIRDKGVIDEKSYNNFLNDLALTGITYDVVIEHHEKVYIPVYVADAFGVETFADDYEIVYDGHYNDEVEAAFNDAAVDNVYKMSVGDMVYIHVENTSATKSQVVKQLLLGASRKYPVIVVRNGGMIRHESD